MNCPVDNETLQMTERSGVEVDYCPRCRGIWLDRGELDKILERAEREFSPVAGRDDRDRVRDRDDDDDDDRRGYRQEYRRDYPPPRKKRKNFLSEMLEFGGD
ncbi:MAG: zf-TFIIB domain-containing protein [Acidimicrobiia bacterium]